jgi:hypothetical protein
VQILRANLKVARDLSATPAQHFDAFWTFCAHARSIRLRIGMLKYASRRDGKLILGLLEKMTSVESRDSELLGRKRSLYRACRENIRTRLDEMLDSQEQEVVFG